MSATTAALTFIGLSGSPHENARGRRRVVTYMSFICFVLIAAALGEEEWVAGKATITRYFNRRSLAYCADPDAEAFGGRQLQGNNSVVTNQYFQIGLSIATVTSSRPAYRTGEVYPTMCSWNIADFVDDWNTGLPNDKTVKMAIFDATEGLLAFALVCQLLAWLAMAAVQLDAPSIGSSSKTVLCVRAFQGAALFFVFVAVVYFGSSPAMKDFCAGFDGSWSTGQGCGFGDGFEIACAALVLLAANEALAGLWMSSDLSDRYGKGGSAAAVSGPNGGSYVPVGQPAAEDPVKPIPAEGGYQSDL